MASRFNHDLIQYVVFNDFGPNIGIGETVVSDRKVLIQNIVAGELGFEEVVAVHAYNAAEGFALDATDDVLIDVEAERVRRKDREDFPLSRFSPSKDEIMAGFDRAIEALKEA